MLLQHETARIPVFVPMVFAAEVTVGHSPLGGIFPDPAGGTLNPIGRPNSAESIFSTTGAESRRTFCLRSPILESRGPTEVIRTISRRRPVEVVVLGDSHPGSSLREAEAATAILVDPEARLAPEWAVRQVILEENLGLEQIHRPARSVTREGYSLHNGLRTRALPAVHRCTIRVRWACR